MAAEFSRCDRDEDLAPLAIERYSCAPPTEQDPEAWKSARTNVRAQLEHQANRVVNLELAESFSEHTWRRHVHDLGRLHAQVAALAEGKEREAEQINLKRKRDQAKLGPDIVRAERAVVERLERHRALEARVAALRKEEAKYVADAAATRTPSPSFVCATLSQRCWSVPIKSSLKAPGAAMSSIRQAIVVPVSPSCTWPASTLTTA